jgi:hypothetical protein
MGAALGAGVPLTDVLDGGPETQYAYPTQRFSQFDPTALVSMAIEHLFVG